MAVSPIIRQLLVIGACHLSTLTAGAAQGFPIVLLLQLRNENSPIKLDLDSATWIGSIHGLAGILSIFVTTFMQWKGRKLAFMVACVIMIVGWVLAYTANNFTCILVSEVFHGCAISALSTIAFLTISEMTSPKYRNFSVQTGVILHGTSVALSGVLSKFLDWKTMSLLLLIPSLLALIMSFSWPESPPWLACNGRFQECEEAFKQIRSLSRSSKKELEELIEAQKENILAKKHQHMWSVTLFWHNLKSREFYLPIVHMFIILCLVYWTGTGVFVINNLEIIQKTTNNDKIIFLGGIISSVLLFLGMVSCNLLSKRFSNKTIVLGSTASAVICLTGLVIVNLLKDFYIVSKESLVCPILVILYVGLACPGLLTVVFTIISEIMPVKYRGIGGALYVIFNSIMYSSSLKLSPYLFLYINLWGTFLIFVVNALICGFLIWRYVPETNNKTLQQIEDFYMFGKFIDTRLKLENDEPFINVH